MTKPRLSTARWPAILAFILLTLLSLLGGACGRSQAEADPPDLDPPKIDHAQFTAPATPGPDLFSDTNIVRIHIVIPKAGLRLLRTYNWHEDRGRERPETTATITEGQLIYTNVALHLKGAAGSYRSIDDRPAFTLNFAKHAKGQKFHGLQKLSLNNSVQDPSFLNEKISRELFLAAGVPVPRADYAVVTLNGRNLGLYVLVEGWNKQFVRRHFPDDSGNLYDGGFCQEITDGLEVNSGDQPSQHQGLQQLIRAAETAAEQRSLAPLAPALDLDRFYTLAAMEILLCHWDGYAMNRNNYRVFHDRSTGRMVFMPHGLDQMFGWGGRAGIDMPLLPPMQGMVALAALGTREGRARYWQRVGELRTNHFNIASITNRLREISRRLAPVLAEFGPVDPREHRDIVDYLSQNIAGRAASIDHQLSAPTLEPEFGADGTAKIAGWKPRNGREGPHLRLATDEGGQKLLYIFAGPGGGATASWRARTYLPPGRYAFEGRARTKGVSRKNDGGAALRVSGSAARQTLKGDADWTSISFPFEIHDAEQPIELICELRGGAGEAWFDTSTLQLRRME